MRLTHATALLATCAALALTGCGNDDSSPNPVPDAGSADTVAPTVTGTTPASDETDVAGTTALTVRFSEPMKQDRGTVRVTADGAQRTVRESQWAPDGRSVTVHPTEALPPGAGVRVTVEADFEDVAGNQLAAPLSFGFTVAPDMAVTRPHVTQASPAEGATGVLPVELYRVDETTTGQRKVISVTFNEPMDTTMTQVTLVDVTTPANAPRTLTGGWSGDGHVLTVTIPRPESDLPPLESENAYTLDLTGLKDAEGHALDTAHAGLRDGKLDFTTGPRDATMEHACLHALVGTPEAVTAGSSPTSVYPATDRAHVFYGLTLPADGASFRGYTEVTSTSDRDQNVALYLDRSVPVVVHDVTEAEDVVASTLEPAPPVCVPAITHALKFTAPADRFLRLTFGPTASETFTFVFERY